MADNDKRKVLYDQLTKDGYELGDFDSFSTNLNDETKRKNLYDAVNKGGYDIGDYNTFSGKLIGKVQSVPQSDSSLGGIDVRPSLKEMTNTSKFAPIDFSRKTEIDAISPYSVESLGYRLQQQKKDGKLDTIINQNEEKEIDKTYAPQKVTNESDIVENYRGRFAQTERGRELGNELDAIRKEVTDKYAKEYKSSERYKQLSAQFSGQQLNEEINKDFQLQYEERISKEIAPYSDAYSQQVFNRYGVGIQKELTALAKDRTKSQLSDLRSSIEQELEKEHPSVQAPAGASFIPGTAYGAAQRYGNTNTKENQDRYTSLVAAKNLLDEADDIVNESSKKGSTNFVGGLVRGLQDKGFDVDTWSMGITDTAYGSLLKKATQKSDKGEALSPEEEKLLEAAAVNMATQAYFSSDLGRGYKAGGTTAQSIPFMLEFALNPVSASGSAIAKGILKFGAKRFGLKALGNAAARNSLKVGSRLAGDAVAAVGMTATTGLGHVASGAQERMIGDVQFDFNKDGKIEYSGRNNQMSEGDAWLRSTISNTLENQSEMVFNAFKGAGNIIGLPNAGRIFPGIERFSSSKAGELYRAIKNNPAYRQLAEKTQFHGMPEEYFEEVYNNLANIPLGESTWNEATDIDKNIDTFLGVAPTSILMSMVGLGSVAAESFSAHRNMRRFEKTLSADELSFFNDLKQKIKDGNIEDAREFVKLTLSDEALTPEQKKEEIRYVYGMLQENTIEAVRNAETDEAIEKEVADIVNSSNQADGTFIECNRITTNETGEIVLVPGNITGWMGEQPLWKPMGAKPTDDAIALKDSEYDSASIQSMSTKDMINATAEMMREEAQKKAEREAKYSPEIAPPTGGVTFSDSEGRSYTIVQPNPDGGWITEVISMDEKGNQSVQMVDISDKEYYDAMQIQIDAREESANMQPEVNEMSGNPLGNEGVASVDENMMGSNEVDTASEVVAPVDESIQEQKPVFPVDEKGNTLYHKMPVEDTIVDLTDGTLDDNEIDGFIEANKAEAGKLLKKVSESAPKISTNKVKYLADKKVWQEKVADAQAQVDYWNSVNEEIAASRVQPGDKTAEAILSMGEPMNGDELAAMMLGTGRLPILYGSYKKETGGRNAEARGMVGLFASKANGGMSIEEAGEQLMLADQESGTNFFDSNDPNAGRNAIIDILSGARTRGDLFSYIQRNREVMAERERQAELEAYEQTIAKLAEASRMTPEEFIAFEENIAQMLEERLKDVSDEELKGIFAELYLEENERGRESNEVGTGVPEGEERVGSNEGSSGILSEEWSDDAGASERSAEQPDGNVETGEPGNSVLPEAATVAGRKELELPTFSSPTKMEEESLLDYAARVDESKRVHDAGKEVDTIPTEAQKEAGNYKKGHVKIDGFDITIENPKGSVRSGVDTDGKPWSITMNNTYGYIRGTEGVDGDHIDVFLGDGGNNVYVVDQVNQDGSFDEHKVMYGFNSEEEARDAYLANYSPGWNGLGCITGVSKELFKEWIGSSHRKTKPFAEYRIAKGYESDAEKRFREVDVSEENGIDDVNKRFNEELNRYENGEMESNEMFHLGTPQGAMLSFLPELPIVMRQRIIAKGSVKKHNVAPESLLNMPKSLSEPIFIFKREDNALGVLTEMKDRGGKNVCVAIALNRIIQDGKETLEVNDIRSIHGRNEADIIFPIIQNGTLRWVDKQKGLDWLSSASRYVQQEIVHQDLSSAAKIVESFENPTIEQGKIISEVEALSDSLHAPVRIVKSVDELTESDSARKRIERGNRVKGWFDTKSQEVVVYLPHAVSVEDANETVLHEVVGHYGLRRMFGEDFDAFLDNVYVNASTEVRKGIVDRANRKGNILDLREATEEYLAELAERGFENAEERSLWQEIKDAFVELLRKAGIELGFELTDNELRYILWNSYQNLESPSIMDRAADVDMQNRLGVGEFRVREEDAEREKSVENYERVLRTVNEFVEKHVGAGSVFVIRSKEMLRKQLEVINVAPEDIDKYERWMEEGKTPAFFAPKYGRIIVLDSSLPKEELNAYLWHESTHKALSDLYEFDEYEMRLNRLYEALEPDYRDYFEYIKELYSEESELGKKDECITNFFEHLYEIGGKRLVNGINKIQSIGIDKEGTLLEIYNYIYYGTRQGNVGRGVRTVYESDQRVNNEPLSEKEMRDYDGDGKQQEAGGRSRDELRGVHQDRAPETSRTLGDDGKSIRDDSQGVRNIYSEEDAGGNKTQWNETIKGGLQDEKVSESISQGEYGKMSEENSRIEEVVSELRRRSSEDAGNARGNSEGLSERKQKEIESGSDKRFRTGESTEEEREPDGTIEAYETALKKQGFRAQEAYQDSMLALKVFQDVVLAKDGGKLKSFEDSYKAENRMSSVSTREKEVFSKVFLNPIITEVARLIKEEDATYRNITGYLIAKHGLERNIVLRERKASEAADKAVKERIDSATREHRKGHMSEDEYNSVINEANLKRNEVYQKELEKNANKDYSGLTGLMENFADEKDGDFTAFAEQFVSDFESKHNTKELWTLINKATSQTLKKSYESGLMSLEQYESLKGRFKNYVPLRGWDETMADEVYEYLDNMRSPVNSLLKSAEGRKSLADDPIATIGNMAESTILQGNRNIMKQNFLNFVINHPSDLAQVKDMWYAKDNVSGDFVPSFPNIPENATAEDIANIVSEHEENMKFLEKDGLAKRGMSELGLSYKILPYQKSEHIVSMKRNGKDVVVYINGNPRVAQALDGLTNPDVESNAILSGLGKLNRILAANFTTRNPAFVLSNLSRDLIFSTSAVAVKETPLYLARFSTNIPKSIAAVIKGIRGNSGTSEADKYFQEFLDNGGETGYANLINVDKYKNMIQKEIKHLTKKDYFKLVRQGLELFEDFNRMAEDVARFNTYMTSRQEGRSIVEAINDAKEITVNFNKKGAGYKSINKLAPWYASGNLAAYSAGIFKNLYLFFNAGIQSLFNFNSLYKKNWKKFGGLLGGFTAAGFLIPLVNSLFQSIGGDGDDEDYYANLSEWTRRNNLCLYIPGSKGHFITIPLPIELRAFYGLGDMAYQQTIGNGGKKGTEIAYDAVNQLTELLPLNPLGNNGDVVATIVPDAFKPLWQVMKNEDFTGRPIYKKNSFNETMPEWTKTYKGTSKWLTELSEWSNELGGGDKYKTAPDFLNWNPAVVEHVLQGYFGGMATTLNQLGKTMVAGVESVVDGEKSDDLTWRNAPVLNRFINDASDERSSFRAVNEKYYQLLDNYYEVGKNLRGYSKEVTSGNLDYLERLNDLRNSKEYETYHIFDQNKRKIDQLVKLEAELSESVGSAKDNIQSQIKKLKKEIVGKVK